MSSIARELISILGESNVKQDEDTLRKHSQDQSPFPILTPGIVVTPGSTEEVASIVKLCNKTKTSILPFGNGNSFTGLSNRRGTATLAIDMKRMNRVLEIDEENLFVRAECGIIVGHLGDRVRDKGYYVNTVAVPYYTDTLGGMMSGVVGGGYPLYSSSVGLNNRHILGLKVVLPNGSIVETTGTGANIDAGTAFIRDANVPDITGMFIGDGGIFGIKTEATLAVYHFPPFWQAGSWLFSDLSGLLLGINKIMSHKQMIYDAILAFGPSLTEIYTPGGSDPTKTCGLVYYVHGFTESEVKDKKSKADKIFVEAGGTRGTGALDEFAEGLRTGESYWKGSEFTEALVRRASCAYFAPKSSFASTFSKVQSTIEKGAEGARQKTGADLTTAYIICVILQNTLWANSIIYFTSDSEKQAVCEIMKKGYETAIQEGAILETHGGYAADAMGASWSPSLRQMISSIKKTIDPNNIFNPDLWSLEQKV